MKKIGTTLMFLTLSLVLCNLASATLTNGGFEDELNGWTLTGAGDGFTISDYTSLSLLPQEGDYFLKLEHIGVLDATLTQNVSLNAGDVLSGWLAYEIAGSSGVSIRVEYDGSWEPIWTQSTGSSSWTNWSWMVPETNTYTLEFSAGASGTSFEAYSNLFVDDIKVASAPVPEPATMLLVGSGLAGLGAFRRRFKK